ncbi:MAG: Ig-like domain-containing protein, partial [Bacteroidales bacterium]|nr:Ig-like domain-containing protein [Bacteroidales bacterium]
TCAVSVTAPTIELRTQFLEDKTTAATFGNVIHFKYGTNYRGTANEFLVVPWDYNKNNVVDDTDASHYTATSSKTANVTVTKEKIGSHYAFVVKAVLNPTSSPEAFSDLTFTYTGPGGTKITKSTRLCIASSSATSAFSYKLKGTQKVGSNVDLTSGAFTYTMQKSGDDGYMRVWVNFDDLKYGVPDTKDMASYTYSNSKSSVVGMSEHTNSASNNPYVELTYKDVGTSNVSVKYIDYKGNKLDKTVKITVNKNYLAGSDRIDYSSTNSNNSTANRYFLPVNKALGLYVRKGDGQTYTPDELVDITWSTSNSNVKLTESSSDGARYRQITGVTPGDVTVTAKGKDGSTRSFFVTVYKDIKSITSNTTTFVLSKGDTHTMVPGVDVTFSPSDATYQKVTDFDWKSTNTGIASVGEKNGVVTGVAKGNADIQLTANKGAAWTSGFIKARSFQIVEPYVEIRSGTSVLPNNTRIANGGTATLVPGTSVTAGLSDSGGVDLNVKGAGKWDSSSSSNSCVSITPHNANDSGYIDIKANSTGTSTVYVVNSGDNGYVRAKITVKVVPKFTWASSDIVANSPGNSRPQDSPGYLAKGTTQTIYAYNGNTTSANAYTSDSSKSILWKSSNTSIATVSPSAGSSTVVTAVGPGKVKITGVDSNGAERSTWIQVYNAVTGITANSKPYLVGYHQSDVTKQMTYGTDYTLSPSNASYTSADNFLWQSGDTSKAEVGYNTGLVTIHSSSFTGPVDITASPNPDGKKVGYKKVRTVKVVSWKGYSTASWSTSSGTLQGSDGTKEKEGIYHFVNNTTVKLDKDQRANIKFYNILDKTPIGDANYQVTSSNSSIVTAGAVNEFTSSNGNYVTLMPKATGKATITMKIVDVDHYFVMTFTVQVI